MFIKIVVIISVIIFGGLSIFQLLLAFGVPFGQYAYGGKHEKLPTNLRINSVMAVGIFVFGIIIVLERASIIIVFNNVSVSGVGIWVFAGYLAFNTILNLLSKSKVEKLVMTPLSLITSVCCFIIAILAL